MTHAGTPSTVRVVGVSHWSHGVMAPDQVLIEVSARIAGLDK
jgi:hypothetical protein